MMYKDVSLVVLFLFLFFTVGQAQTDRANEPWSVNEGTLIGAGGYKVMDSYLSPGDKIQYSGWSVRLLNERMKMVRLADYNVARQQFINVEVGSTENRAGTAIDFVGFLDYSLGYLYRFNLRPNLKVLTGASARIMGGFIYNTRNGNNPASAKADLDLNLSAMALYHLKIKEYPLVFRYQLEIPFAGVLFSPHYGQSYYEIFNLKNSGGVVCFSSFHNKFVMRNYFTVDFPVSNFTVRAGYMGNFYKADVNGIQTHLISNSFMIGLVKEFVSFGGKRLKQHRKYKSAYY